ncbi:MAG: glycosyltransferase 87 family protein [Thermoleophilia bacterium]
MPPWFETMRQRFDSLPTSRKRWLITGLFLLAQLVIWSAVFEVFWYGDRSITDTPVYYQYASRIAQGMFPYRDFSLEYPPVAVLLFSLPRLISGPDYTWFVFAFEAEMLAFSCGIVVVLSIIAWRQWQSIGKLAGVLGTYTIFLLCLGSIVELRFDLAAAFLILASVACFITDRRLAAWLLLGVGIMTKIIPVLIAPIFLISHFRRRQYNQMISGPALMLVAALAIAIPFLIAAPEGLANAFLYHVERPLQLESTWSTPLLLMAKYSGYSVSIMNSYGSHNVFSSLSNTLALLSGPVTILVMLISYGVYWRRSRGDSPLQWDSSQVIRFAVLTIAIFIFGGKVFSPQFLIWLLPLIPLIKGRDRGLITGLFAAVLLLTQWEFPARYWELYLLQKQMVVEVAARNVLLGLLAVVLLVSTGRQGRLERAEVPEAERVAV